MVRPGKKGAIRENRGRQNLALVALWQRYLGRGLWNSPRGTRQRPAIWVWHCWLVPSPEHVPGRFIQLCQKMSMCDMVNQHFLLRRVFSNQRAFLKGWITSRKLAAINWKNIMKSSLSPAVFKKKHHKMSGLDWPRGWAHHCWMSWRSDGLLLMCIYLEIGMWRSEHRKDTEKLRFDREASYSNTGLKGELLCVWCSPSGTVVWKYQPVQSWATVTIDEILHADLTLF